MARTRSIKPGFFQNEFMARKRPESQLLFIGLLTIADREGRIEDRPAKIKASVFPYADVDVEAAIDELASIDDPFQDQPFIYRYIVDGRRYIQIVNWDKHQNVHPKEPESCIPAMQTRPSSGESAARSDSNVVLEVKTTAQSRPRRDPAVASHGSATVKPRPSRDETAIPVKEGIEGIEGIQNTKDSPLGDNSKSKGHRPKFTPPTVEEVTSYVKSKGYLVDPVAFVAFYASKGWLVGKAPMKDWKSSVVVWHTKEHRDREGPPGRPRERTQEEIIEDRKRRELAQQEKERKQRELEKRRVSS